MLSLIGHKGNLSPFFFTPFHFPTFIFLHYACLHFSLLTPSFIICTPNPPSHSFSCCPVIIVAHHSCDGRNWRPPTAFRLFYDIPQTHQLKRQMLVQLSTCCGGTGGRGWTGGRGGWATRVGRCTCDRCKNWQFDVKPRWPTGFVHPQTPFPPFSLCLFFLSNLWPWQTVPFFEQDPDGTSLPARSQMQGHGGVTEMKKVH